MIAVRTGNEPASLTAQEFALFQRLILREAGIFLSDAKRALLVGRLIRRVRELELPTFGAYYARIAGGDGAELVRLLDAIATNETHFFREPRQFDLLEGGVCNEWLADAAAGRRARRVRVWSAACSTGEEPYSIAMVLLERLGADWEIEIAASDLSTKVLERAAQGVWPIERADEIPEHYRRRFMLRGVGPEEGNCRAGKAVRAPVRFERINLNDSEYPVTGMFDAIFCRNVLIYFDPSSRAQVIDRLTRRLVPGGYLFLGHSESAARSGTDLVAVMPAVYRRRESVAAVA
ncbi:MAG TPA: protein-glutamate O-methyltransferase CheR [Gemmatimonadales bacterium]|nr:protein-glutamate O-methyltransferase CheR [Gemmatimonadales bacterium]